MVTVKSDNEDLLRVFMEWMDGSGEQDSFYWFDANGHYGISYKYDYINKTIEIIEGD